MFGERAVAWSWEAREERESCHGGGHKRSKVENTPRAEREEGYVLKAKT